MRVAFFTETFLPHTDGIVTRLLHTLAELRASGHEAIVVAPQRRGLPANYEGTPVLALPSVPLLFSPDVRLGLPLLTLSQRATLRAFAPDIVHAVNPVAVGWRALSYALAADVPFVASYHTNIPDYAHRYRMGAFEGFLWGYLRTLHNRARLNLCTSAPMVRLLREHHFCHVALWEPGVDAARFHPDHRTAAWRERLTDGHPGAISLLYVGRLAHEKELKRLVPVLAAQPGYRLALVGDGPARDDLRAAFAGLNATFLGPLHGEELAAAYASTDIFVFPSPTETLGLAAIEAMASGVPVVGARRGGVPHVVADGETGLLFEPDLPDDLACQIAALADDAEARRRMGAAARARAEGWSWSATTAGLVAYYATLLAQTTSSDDAEAVAAQR